MGRNESIGDFRYRGFGIFDTGSRRSHSAMTVMVSGHGAADALDFGYLLLRNFICDVRFHGLGGFPGAVHRE
jgi:hypothetical protein